MPQIVAAAVVFLSTLCLLSEAWVSSPSSPFVVVTRTRASMQQLRQPPFSLLQSTAEEEISTFTFNPVFDFSDPKTVNSFDRLDDAIMGGISTSSIMAAATTTTNDDDDDSSNTRTCAKWFGVCRTDGGGFCGFRTNPFREPLQVNEADGFFIQGRLASDDEPERRVWKMTTRIKPDRGEVVYQAPFVLSTNWTRIRVPFESFQLVRGPRQVPDAPPLNVSAGIYQVGMTMSKFAMGVNTTELANFRDGFFEVQLREIGFYRKEEKNNELAIEAPQVLSKQQAMSKRPVFLKVLLPLAKLFFSEQSQRRKSAMKILREKRGLSRGRAILFGLRSRAKTIGIIPSLLKTGSILAVDVFRAVALTSLRLLLFTPLRLMRKAARSLKRSNDPGPLTE